MPARQSDVDACPGALRLHAAADGPLARVRLPGGLLTGERLAVLASLAATYGDGHLELTSRANVQIRALREADPTVLAAHLHAAGLLPSETHETVRNIAAPPLADATLRGLVAGLDRALCADPALAALPGRFLFAVGKVPLTADVAAVPDGDAFTLHLAAHDTGLRIPANRVVEALLAAAHAFLTERARTASKAWRLHELPDGPNRVAAELGPSLMSAPSSAAVEDETSMIGLLPQPDGLVAVGALVPLGRLGGKALQLLTTARRLVFTTWRGVVVPDLTHEDARQWARALAEAGLPVDATSRWAGVTACAGRPGCAKSLADVRADADDTSAWSDGLPVHWIGCARGCGSPPGPHVRVEATPAGYAVTRQPGGETFTGDTAHAVAAARRN
ncbi:nitrite/sulfite reductase [Actinoplanes solisilvae]|uniref:nitrite/sulfite reductase n=1 Tax=Actinoplanes solisilvae TaxID=2486853 RepID=UPI001F0BF624|nr:nitrite/sulfite reductase [Actinoplanes solisilvae]